MSKKHLSAPIVAPAQRGSKLDWVTVSGEIPPTDSERLDALMRDTGKRRTDVVAEAVKQYLDRHEDRRERDRRTAERRSA